jgi:glycoprotein-N-acetylgalactosamine 3-beta-galactosyltransferase
MAASTKTDPSLGVVDLPHAGPKEYSNMWQKTTSILAFLYDLYLEEYDFFYLAGDETYLIVENLRSYLRTLDQTQPLYIGSQVRYREETYVLGGAGYLLNRVALRQLVQKALPTC